MSFDTLALIHFPIAMCESFAMYVFFSRLLGKRHTSNKLYLGFHAFYVLSNGALSIFNIGYVALFTIMICFIYSFFLYGGTKVQRVFCAGLLTAYMFIVELFAAVLSSFLFDFSLFEIGGSISMFYIGAFASKALLLILAFVVTGRAKARMGPVPYYHLIMLLAVTYICAGLSYTNITFVGQSGDAATPIHVLASLGIAVVAVLVFFVFRQLQTHAEREIYMAVVEQHLAENEMRFQLIDSQNVEIISIKHDIINHLTSIRKMAADGEYKELDEYLSEYLNAVTPSLTRSITGKPSIDALLSEKTAQAEGHGIRFTVNSGTLRNMLFSPVHLNVILSNAIDNAIDACLKTSDTAARYIKADIVRENENIYIRVENSSPSVEIFSGRLPKTSKIDADQHGYGLATVNRLLLRYNGKMECKYQDGTFVFYAQIKDATDSIPT